MRNVFKLFSYDIKHLFGNVITVVIVLGLVFLPSIFTWYNVLCGGGHPAKLQLRHDELLLRRRRACRAHLL